MKLSTISATKYRDGADQVIAREYPVTSKQPWTSTVTTGTNKTALDLTGATLKLNVEYGKSSLSYRAGLATINSLELDTNIGNATDLSSLVTVTSAIDGAYTVNFPQFSTSPYSITPPFNSDQNVPTVIGTLTIADGKTVERIYTIRFLIFLRYATTV